MGFSETLKGKKKKILGLFVIAFLALLFIFPRASQKEEPSFFSREGLFKNKLLVASLTSFSFSLRVPSEIFLAQENQVLSPGPPNIIKPQVLGALGFSEGETKEGREIFEYSVKNGDSLSKIASSFNISLNTLLWANDLSKNSTIKPGQKLVILPVSGVLHLVKKGETLSQIAKTYGGRTEEMIAFNGLSKGGEVFVGDLLIIPGGKMPEKPAPVRYAPLASSYFICPIASPCRITQGLHWYNAIDFAHTGISCGEPVFAAAGGKVLKTMFGYNKGAGNYIHLKHPNAVISHYGHLETILVSPGQPVSQGQIIGLIGHTGYTFPSGPQGCHLHFEVRGARNPFAY